MRNCQELHGDALDRRLHELAAQDRCTTAELLVRLAAAEAEHLHLRKGYDSLKAYCVEALLFSEDAARRRVHAAHVVRAYPAMLGAVEDGRLHLTAIHLLAPHLSPSNVHELIEAAAHKTKAEIEIELVRRYPRAEALRLDDGVLAQVIVPQRADAEGRALARMDLLPDPRPASVAPITVARFLLEVSIDAETEDDLRAVQNLLARDVAQTIKLSLKHMRQDLERKKYAQVAHPQQSRESSSTRTIPANVRRAVFERDAGRCAFVGESGHRCGSRFRLEFDHIVPVALGGQSTVENVRLACRAHNQYEADRKLGRLFMQQKRSSGMDEATRQIASGLRNLGMSATEARQCAEATNAEGSIEERLREALRMVKVRGTSRSAPSGAPAAVTIQSDGESEELVESLSGA